MKLLICYSLYCLLAPALFAKEYSPIISEYVQIYNEVLLDLPQEIQLPNGQQLTTSELFEQLKITQYKVQDQLWHNGVEVSALNIKGVSPEVIISAKYWSELSLMSKKSLILHEQVSLAGFNDKTYDISSYLYNRITSPQVLNDEYLMTGIAACDSTLLKKLSRVDIKLSIPTYLNKNLIYVAIYNGCVQFIQKALDWQWDFLKISNEALSFNEKTNQPEIIKKEISHLLMANKKSDISYGTPMTASNGGGQETNGGNGIIAEYLNIFQKITQNLPQEIVLNEGLRLKRQQLASLSFNEILAHQDWNHKNNDEKQDIVIIDQLNKLNLKTDYLRIITQKLNGIQKENFQTLSSKVMKCDRDYLVQLNSKIIKNNFSDEETKELLSIAIKSQCLDFINLWSDWNFTFNYCQQPLSLAITNGNAEIVNQLLSNGANPQFYCRGELRPCQLIDSSDELFGKMHCSWK